MDINQRLGLLQNKPGKLPLAASISDEPGGFHISAPGPLERRHTYAVLSLQNGDDVKTVQGNLDHAAAAFTLDVYGHVSDRMKEDSANRMQSCMDRVSGL